MASKRMGNPPGQPKPGFSPMLIRIDGVEQNEEKPVPVVKKNPWDR